MINVHLFFLKLTGCMIAEAKANGHDVPIPLDPFSDGESEIKRGLNKMVGVRTVMNPYCLPDEATLGQIGDTFCKYLRQNPAIRHESGAHRADKALKAHGRAGSRRGSLRDTTDRM